MAVRPICRGLREFQQRHLSSNLHITSIRDLDLAARILGEVQQQSPRRLGPFIKRLWLGGPSWRDWARLARTRDEHAWAQEHGHSYHVVPLGAAAGLLKSLLDALCGLESLYVYLGGTSDVGDPDELAMLRLIFEDPSTLDHISSINEVRLETYGPVLDAAFPANAGAWLYQLGRLLRLETLELSFCPGGMPTILQGSAPVVLEQVRKFKISALFDAWRIPLRHLVPDLASLEVVSTASGAFLGLRRIIGGAPPSLAHLAITLDDTSQDEDAQDELIDDLFLTFPLLRSLHLDISCYDPTRLPSSLARLADLQVLHFGHAAVVPDHTLVSLVTGLCRIKSLRKLTLDYVKVYFGSNLRSEGGKLPRNADRDEFGLLHNWAAPEWPEGCSEAGVAAAVRLGRSHGVVVAGSAVHALDWLGEYVAERDTVARRRGFEMDDWQDARRFFGARVVEILKEEQQAARGWPEGFAGALLRSRA